MRGPGELLNIVDHLDADPKTTAEHGKISDLWFVNRMKKVSGSVSGLVNKIASDDLGVKNLDWDNVEQIFNPYISGVCSMDE